MIEAFWIPLLPPYLIGLVLSFAVEALLTPRPVAPWRRPSWALAVHLGIWTVVFAGELALFRRPYFGMANVLALQSLIVLVNNAKYNALREPFVFADFDYFVDVVKHPRLYLPFFGLLRTAAAAGGYGAAVWAGLTLEDSVTAGGGVLVLSLFEAPRNSMGDSVVPLVPFYAQIVIMVLFGVALTVRLGRGRVATFQAVQDLRRLGLFSALWVYACEERKPIVNTRKCANFSEETAPNNILSPMPDMLVIQSESFFDARITYPNLLRKDILSNFDTLNAESMAHGLLKVDAWGANTVRTEFSFLSGLNSEDLGVHKYNPYRKLPRMGLWTVARHLKTLGYRTICVHPFHRGFYRRDEVLPLMGFDEFIGIEAFDKFKRVGAYVGDRDLGEYVAKMLSSHEGAPLYIHVITMENHGPLHWEKIEANNVSDVLTTNMPDDCEDLVAYARHLRNADAMFGTLIQTLKSRRRSSVMCIFGDHVPIMPSVYQKLGQPDGFTNYVIWNSEKIGESADRVTEVSTLGRQYLAAAGLR